jgi:hypothetical protein
VSDLTEKTAASGSPFRKPEVTNQIYTALRDLPYLKSWSGIHYSGA